MTTALPKKASDYLRAYSLDVAHWDAEMGDTDQMLGRREILGTRRHELSVEELGVLRRLDQQVLALAAGNPSTPGWDAVMLRKTAALIQGEALAATALKAA